MPYAPYLEEVFEEKVIDNAIVIIARDMKPALDYFYAAGNYPDFAERTLGNFIRKTYPALAVEPLTGASVESEHYTADTLRVDFNFAVAHAEAPTATRLAIKYNRALKSVLRNGSLADYLTGISSPQISGLVKDFEWTYGEPAKDPNVSDEFLVPVILRATFKFIQR